MFEKHINKPTRSFEVGEHVQIGNLSTAIIEKKLDGGKEYLVRTSKTTRDGVENSVSTWAWHCIFKIKDTTNAEQFSKTESIHISHMNADIESGLLHRFYSFGIDTEIDYQRGNVWTKKDKVALIDSIFNNIEIGQFVFAKNSYSRELLYEIVDGKQRLTALMEFYEDRFSYKGKKFTELHPQDQYHFKSYLISIGEVSKKHSSEELTLSEKCQLFLKLNTTGHVQSKKHLQYVQDMLEKALEDENLKS